MVISVSARTRRAVLFACLAFLVLSSASDLLAHGSSAWLWVVGYAFGSFLLVGPVVWIARDRISASRREALLYPVFGAVFLCFVLAFGVELALGGALFFFDAGTVGSIAGLALAYLLERTVVPERLRAPEHRRT
ncbi:hypothetical protein EL22_15210 [Halostagnicola sp. A56]|uniref:hypothetical protein n=1 Tax=Halostagnicola sp. A56 TaxID=1495067 RepID=UPI0004A11A87|nr:hypothetical protein [Halostagnicola sp. A56]KDE59926.1 hypothetical protein EL22_15210 [Halostagnicola sp. A56]